MFVSDPKETSRGKKIKEPGSSELRSCDFMKKNKKKSKRFSCKPAMGQ
jgi:hypothetical protein